MWAEALHSHLSLPSLPSCRPWMMAPSFWSDQVPVLHLDRFNGIDGSAQFPFCSAKPNHLRRASRLAFCFSYGFLFCLQHVGDSPGFVGRMQEPEHCSQSSPGGVRFRSGFRGLCVPCAHCSNPTISTAFPFLAGPGPEVQGLVWAGPGCQSLVQSHMVGVTLGLAT